MNKKFISIEEGFLHDLYRNLEFFLWISKYFFHQENLRSAISENPHGDAGLGRAGNKVIINRRLNWTRRRGRLFFDMTVAQAEESCCAEDIAQSERERQRTRDRERETEA